MSSKCLPLVTPLNLSAAEKVAQFREMRILHPRLIELESQLMAAVADSPRNSIIYVYGPSGVGKSTLKEKAENRVRRESAQELATDNDRIALVSVEAPSPDSGHFSWREHFKAILECLDEPLIDLRKDRNGLKLSPRLLVAARENARIAVGAYQTSVVNALKYRKPVALFADEAQHIAKVTSGRRLVDQLDVIKSIANGSNTPHVLIGTYELLGLRNLNGQAARRSLDLHFGRYRADVEADAIAFRDVVDSFAKRLPFEEPPDLLQVWDFLYERSIGCIGILKDWLARALSHALRDAAPTLRVNHLQSTALSMSKVDKLLIECITGESRLAEIDDDRKHLRIRMGLDREEQAQKSASKRSQDANSRKSFQRIPKRDPIGIEAPTGNA
jgi:Cdc6-like AAA superfamily ATPase